jgi:hypothetical protein
MEEHCKFCWLLSCKKPFVNYELHDMQYEELMQLAHCIGQAFILFIK